MCASARRRLLFLVTLAALSVPADAGADGRSTLTFNNRRGEALVRLAGPTSGLVDVPDASTRTIRNPSRPLSRLRQDGRPGRYSYTRRKPFSVAENNRQDERVGITLHVVTDNYVTKRTRSVNLDAR